MLGRRRRRRFNIKSALAQRLVFAGSYVAEIFMHPTCILAIMMHHSAIQVQTAVTNYLKSELLLLFALTRRHCRTHDVIATTDMILVRGCNIT